MRAKIEAIIDARRVHSVADDVKLLATMLITGVVDYTTVVRLLGGRPPSDEPGEDAYSAGSWGDDGVDSGGTAWRVDVPKALGHAGELLAEIFGMGIGCRMGKVPGFGLRATAEAAIADGLSADNTKALFVEWFQGVAYSMERLRTTRDVIPDWVTAGEEARVCV